MFRSVRLVSFALALLVSLGLARGEDPGTLLYGTREVPEKQAGAIRLASYNVLNLYDHTDDPELDDRWETPKPEEELEAVAKAIRAIDADILALQEVESLEALVWFRDTYLDSMGYEYAASLDVAYFRGIENSVLSRFPITSATVWIDKELEGQHPELWNDRPNRYHGEPLLFRRSPLCVDIQVNEEYSLRLYVVHKKAGRGNEYWREAETRAVISMIERDEKEDPEINIAVVGDLNAQPFEWSARRYLRAGLVDTMRHRGYSDCFQIERRYVTHESNRTIDYILVNSGLLREVIPGSGFVYSTPARPEGHDWRIDRTPKGYASDHYPLVVDLIPRDR